MWCWEVRSGWQCGDGRASEEADPCPHSRGPGAWQLAAEWAWPCGCHATCHMSPHLSSRGCWLLPRRRPPATTTPPRSSSRAARASPSSTWIFGGWAGPGAQTRMLGEVQTFFGEIKWKTEFRKCFVSSPNYDFFSEYRRYVRNCCVVATILYYSRCCQFIASSFIMILSMRNVWEKDWVLFEKTLISIHKKIFTWLQLAACDFQDIYAYMFCLVVVNMNCLRSLEQMIFLGLIKTFVVSVLTVPRIEDVECGQSARWWLVTWHITLQSLSSSPALVHYFIKFC